MNGRTLSFNQMKIATERMKEFCSVKEFCKSFNFDYDEFNFYEIVPNEIEQLVKNNKIPLFVAKFLVIDCNFDMEKKIKVAGYFARKTDKKENPIETLYLVLKNYDKKERQRMIKEDREEEEFQNYFYRRK